MRSPEARMQHQADGRQRLLPQHRTHTSAPSAPRAMGLPSAKLPFNLWEPGTHPTQEVWLENSYGAGAGAASELTAPFSPRPTSHFSEQEGECEVQRLVLRQKSSARRPEGLA